MEMVDEKITHLVDSAHGIYIPQIFAEGYSEAFEGISDDDYRILLGGPDDELYWDSWDTVLNNARYVVGDHSWTLEQDSDLFMIRDDYENEDE